MPRATSHLETDVINSAEKSKPRSVAVSSIIAVAVCTTGAASFGREPREKLVHGARERQAAHRALWVVHDPHE